MNFDFDEEQRLLQKTARDFLEERAPLARVREIFESDALLDAALGAGVAEMGWTGAAIPESHGGAGFGYLELALLAEETGRALAPIPFGSSVYLVTEALRLAGSDEQQRRWLPELAAGRRIGAFAAAEGPGGHVAAEPGVEWRDGALHGVKEPVLDGAAANLALVWARDPSGGRVLVLADLQADGAKSEPLESLDPSRPLACLVFEGTRAERLQGDGAPLLARLEDRAAVLFAFEQLGGAQRCLEEAIAFARSRYAFGRPIASFQAVKHQLADLYTAVELARSNCYYGAWALHAQSDELPAAACLARISATEAFEACSRESLHLHGGVGFTWEYDCHLFLRRSKLLSLALGSTGRWKDRLVALLDEAD